MSSTQKGGLNKEKKSNILISNEAIINKASQAGGH
jgi:hypothetical protein